MMAQRTTSDRLTANDRFKRSFGGWVWGSITLAAVFHFALFEYFPKLTAAELPGPETIPTHLLPPPKVDVPDPPDEIPHPKVPIPGDTKVDESLTIHPTTFVENPVEDLPPPPVEGMRVATDRVRYTVRPGLKDPAEAQRIVQRLYPPLLKSAGIGGRVTVLAYVDTLGHVLDAETAISSGNQALDEAALKAVKQFQFTPALNRDRKVLVWIQQAIVFEVK